MALGAAALFGCAEEPNLGTTASISFEEFKAQAEKNRDSSGAYIVDWDIAIRGEERLYQYWAQGPGQQGALTISTLGGADNRWSDTQKIQLTYCISTTSFNNPTDYAKVKAAFDQATADGWEKFADIDFVHRTDQDASCTNTNTNVLFDVNRVSGQPYLARAFFPPPGDDGDGRAVANVLVDATAINGTPDWPLANIIGHELGHVLGVRHAHIRPEAQAPQNCREGTDFRALTAYDSSSIMHYPHCNGTSQDLAFTMIDAQGAELLYGKPIPNLTPMVMINKPSDGATVTPTFAIETSVIDADLTKVELFIDGVLHSTVAPAGPFDFEAMELLEGAHEIKLVATDRGNQVAMQGVDATAKRSRAAAARAARRPVLACSPASRSSAWPSSVVVACSGTRSVRAAATFVLAVGCASSPRPAPAIRCTTFAMCAPYDQERVELVGIYRVWDKRSGATSGETSSRRVTITLDDADGGPFLEAGHDPRHSRSPDEIARFRDQRVRVVGRFVRSMPQVRPPHEEQLGGPCISDVESIVLDD